MYFVHNFSNSVMCLCIFLAVSFAEQKVFKFNEVQYRFIPWIVPLVFDLKSFHHGIPWWSSG